MKVETPEIAWHNRERVSSVDFQPKPWPATAAAADRLRVASGGDDKHVVIWQLSSSARAADARAASAVDSRPPSKKKSSGSVAVECLCDLARHQNTVNAVKWSPDGKLLASGDTDKVIMLWTYSERSGVPDLFGDDDDMEGGRDDGGADDERAADSENWGLAKILRGHLNDVIGLHWSPCASFLASCSTDDTAVVFDVAKGSKVATLTDGKGWLNGVAWDPKDKYVVTMCSDRYLRVYSTKNFKCQLKLSKCKLPVAIAAAGQDGQSKTREERSVKLFADDSFQLFYRRLAFSPDGEILAVPSGVLEVDGSAAVPNATHVFTRLDFSKPVLHLPCEEKEFSVAVRFCPLLFELRRADGGDADDRDGDADSNDADDRDDDAEDKKPWEKHRSLFALPYRMIYAVATQKSVMLYDTQQAEPIARVTNIHYVSLNDLTWSPDGRLLVVASTDGFCSIIRFKNGELGQVYTKDENCQLGHHQSASSNKERASASSSAANGKENEPVAGSTENGASAASANGTSEASANGASAASANGMSAASANGMSAKEQRTAEKAEPEQELRLLLEDSEMDTTATTSSAALGCAAAPGSAPAAAESAAAAKPAPVASVIAVKRRVPLQTVKKDKTTDGEARKS